MRFYRVYRRDPVAKGKWYYAAACSGCAQPIYLLDDNSGGTKPVQMYGGGRITACCPRCLTEGAYEPSSIECMQSSEDLPGARPPRVAISNSPRKPLLRSYSKAHTTFGVGYIEDRPKAAAIVARIITAWADIEVESARLLAELMGTNVPQAAAVFGSIRNSKTQYDALEAVAKMVLDERDFELFAAHMARRASLEKERNDLAHGCFGVSLAIPEGIVWVSQTDFITFTANSDHDPTAPQKFKESQFVYELGTLERISQEIEELYHQFGFFRGYLHARHDPLSGPIFRAERYRQLCSQSHIQQALDRIRTAKKASKSPHKENPSKKKRG